MKILSVSVGSLQRERNNQRENAFRTESQSKDFQVFRQRRFGETERQQKCFSNSITIEIIPNISAASLQRERNNQNENAFRTESQSKKFYVFQQRRFSERENENKNAFRTASQSKKLLVSQLSGSLIERLKTKKQSNRIALKKFQVFQQRRFSERGRENGNKIAFQTASQSKNF